MTEPELPPLGGECLPPSLSPSPARAEELGRAASAAAESLSRWPSWPPSPSPPRKAGPRRPPPPLILRSTCQAAAAGALSLAALAHALNAVELDDAERAVEDARAHLATVQVSGPSWRGTKLRTCTPLEYALTHVSAGDDPIHGRIITAALMPRDMDAGSAVDHCAEVVGKVRDAGHHATHGYIGKGTCWAYPRGGWAEPGQAG